MLPLIKHPTKLIFVDDDNHFLLPLAEMMRFSATPSLTDYYNSALQAVEDLKSIKTSTQLDKCLKYNVSGQMRTESVSVQLAPLLQGLYTAERFNRISFVFADQKMPQMGGLDFLDRIKNEHISKVLLTSTVTLDEAVVELNRKRIDAFLDKDTKLFENIENVLKEGVEGYFLRLTQKIQSLFNQSSSPFSAFDDPVFEQYFRQLLAEENIIEYYAIEHPGSSLLIDELGNKKILWVKTQEQQESLIDVMNPDKKTANAIKNGSCTICSLCSPEFLDQINIKSLLRPAKIIKGKELYFVSLSDDISSLNLEEEKIITFSMIRPNIIDPISVKS